MLVAAAAVITGSTTWLSSFCCARWASQRRFSGPLKYAILPELLAPHKLTLGNALVEGAAFVAILLGTIAGVLIASRHGAALIAGLIVLVALAAWASSLAIPPTAAAAPRGGGWALEFVCRCLWRVVREAAGGEIVPFRAILGISWFWLAGAVYLSRFPSMCGSGSAVKKQS